MQVKEESEVGIGGKKRRRYKRKGDREGERKTKYC